jgi:hypothetical protein
LPPWRVSIVGAERCTAARCDLSAGIQADNRAGTVTFRLRSPEPDFLYQLALPYADVLPSSTPFRVLKRPEGAGNSICPRSRRGLVFVDEASEHVSPPNTVKSNDCFWFRRRLSEWRLLVEGAVGGDARCNDGCRP